MNLQVKSIHSLIFIYYSQCNGQMWLVLDREDGHENLKFSEAYCFCNDNMLFCNRSKYLSNDIFCLNVDILVTFNIQGRKDEDKPNISM